MQIVTGATGFVGSFLSAALWRRYGRVALLVHNAEDISKRKRIVNRLEGILCKKIDDHKTVQMFCGDITAPDLGMPETELKTFGDVDAVWHCAAASQFNTDNKKIFLTNALGTRRVLEFAHLIGAKRFYYVSTAYICGNRTGIVYEDELEAGQVFRNAYEESKFRAENLVRQWGLQYGKQTTIYRPSIIVGSSVDGRTLGFKGYNYLTQVFFRQRNIISRQLEKDPTRFNGSGICKNGDTVIFPVRIPCSTDATVNLVTIDYVIAMMLKLADNAASLENVFHIINPTPPKGRDLFKMSADVMKLEGLSFVGSCDEVLSNPPKNKILNRFEKRVNREISQYIPYLRQEANFADLNVRRVLGADYTPPCTIDLHMVQKLFDYAKSVNWRAE
jgi:nucleoside-diphosphate-sugar epimerase